MSQARDLADLGSSAEAGTVTGDNLIINGDMTVAQRGTSFTAPSSSAYTLDRWRVIHGQDGAVDVSQSTTAPPNFKNSLKLDVTTADTSLSSGQYYIVQHKMEGQFLSHLNYGSSDAKQVTLSFWVRSNKTGTYHVELQTYDSEELARQYTIDAADTWEYKTLTWIANTDHTIPEDNSTGLHIYWWLAAGSAYDGSPIATTWANNTNRVDGQTNFLDSTSNEFYLTGCKLEVGTTATPFQHESYAENLAKCQRYFQRLYAQNSASSFGTGASYSNVAHYFTYHHPVSMRATPSIGRSALADLIVVGTGTSKAPSTLARQGGTNETSEFLANTATALGSSGNACWIRIKTADKYVEWNADL